MRTLTTAAALLLCASPAFADVLEPALVDARAQVLIHVDIGALTQTTLFGLLQEDPESGIEDALQEFEDEVGLNLLRDVHSLTVYSNDVEDHWVALLRTGERLDDALKQLEGRPGYVQTRAGGKTIHSLHDDGMEWHGHLYRLSVGGERLFVIAEEIDVLVEAVRVVDGELSNVLKVDEPAVTFEPSPGSVLFVSADRGLGELGDFPPSAEVSKLVTGILFECGESDGNLFASLRLTTATEKDAKHIHDVIQGGLAMASLIAGGADETGMVDELINALELKRNKAAVTFVFRYPSQALYEGLAGLREMADGDHR